MGTRPFSQLAEGGCVDAGPMGLSLGFVSCDYRKQDCAMSSRKKSLGAALGWDSHPNPL